MRQSLLATVRAAVRGRTEHQSLADAEGTMGDRPDDPAAPETQSAPGAQTERTVMSETTGEPAADTAGVITQEQFDTAVATARAEGAATERERIKAIRISQEATGREAMADHLAFNTTDDAEKAIALLAAAPQASSGSSLASRMAGIGNADLGTGAAGAGEPVDGRAKGAAIVGKLRGKAK